MRRTHPCRDGRCGDSSLRGEQTKHGENHITPPKGGMPVGAPESGASPSLPDAGLATPECRPLKGHRIESGLTEHRLDCLLPRDNLCRNPG